MRVRHFLFSLLAFCGAAGCVSANEAAQEANEKAASPPCLEAGAQGATRLPEQFRRSFREKGYAFCPYLSASHEELRRVLRAAFAEMSANTSQRDDLAKISTGGYVDVYPAFDEVSENYHWRSERDLRSARMDAWQRFSEIMQRSSSGRQALASLLDHFRLLRTFVDELLVEMTPKPWRRSQIELPLIRQQRGEHWYRRFWDGTREQSSHVHQDEGRNQVNASFAFGDAPVILYPNPGFLSSAAPEWPLPEEEQPQPGDLVLYRSTTWHRVPDRPASCDAERIVLLDAFGIYDPSASVPDFIESDVD